MKENWSDVSIMKDVVDACYEVYRTLGRCFVEKAYKIALAQELRFRGYKDILVEEWIDIDYKGAPIEKAFKADIIVDHQLIVELKAVPELTTAHHSQLQSYMLFADIPYGLLVNFHANLLKDNISRKSLAEIKSYQNLPSLRSWRGKIKH